jgi:hypothetical protein
MSENWLQCGFCRHLGPTIPTHVMKTRPVGYCWPYCNWRLRFEVVRQCPKAELQPLDTPGQQAFDPKP